MSDRISVIIPTRNRPDLVCRAVDSALAQTYQKIEIVVVIDGPDEKTLHALSRINDSRVRVLPLPKNVGGSDARNIGVKAAAGEWIAFLDDDDEWMQDKLAKQIEASRLSGSSPIISSLVIARSPSRDYVWPKRMPEPGEPISEYLFSRRSIEWDGLLQTSTLLIRKALLERVPFRSGLRKHQDWDWLLRAAQLKEVSFKIVPEALAIWHIEEKRKTIGSESMWRYSLTWLRENRHLFTPRAYSGFVASSLAQQAAREGAWKAFAVLLREMVRFGSPTPFDYYLYFGMWFVPQPVRRRVRAILKRA